MDGKANRNLQHLRVFGWEALAHIPKEKRDKWDLNTEKLIFVGWREHERILTNKPKDRKDDKCT